MKRVAVIGLDAAPPELVFEKWRERLPNLTALCGGGCWGPLRSSHPPVTVPAWASMTCSKDPGQLGVYGFRNRRAHTYDGFHLASSDSITHDRVWDVLSRAGKRVIVLGVPQTYPPTPVNGCMVTGFLTPSADSPYTYPSALRPEIERVANGYVFDVADFRTPDKPALLGRIFEKTRKHFAVARHLLCSRPWDFFMMVEMGPDRIHHGFWKYFDPAHPKHEAGNRFEHCVREYYEYLDGEIGELLQLVDADTAVLVVSDHGARALEGGICVNEWLMRRGDLTLHHCPDTVTPIGPDLIDWSRTRVWGEGGYCGRLFLNVRGREPQGRIHPHDYERVRDDLIAAVAAIEDPGGRVIGSHAHRPEELYAATTGVPPDLIVYFGDLRWRSLGSVGFGRTHCLDNDTGPDDANHDWNGVFIMRDGRTTGAGQRVEGLELMDVAPTILHQFGVPIPTDMLGRVIDAGRVCRGGGDSPPQRGIAAPDSGPRRVP